MVEVYAVRLDCMPDASTLERLISHLSQDRHHKIQSFYREEDRHRTLISDITIRYLLSRKIGINSKDIKFITNKYGKPSLNCITGIHFNVSHSKDWVVFAIHSLPVGIDIEFIDPIDIDIAKRFFAENEYRTLVNKTANVKLAYFYDLWTLKESYVKFKGKGLSIPLNSFSISFNRDDIVMEPSSLYEECFFQQYHIDRHYKMAVCAAVDDFPGQVVVIEFQKITKDVLAED